jgi:hypothetical protein
MPLLHNKDFLGSLCTPQPSYAVALLILLCADFCYIPCKCTTVNFAENDQDVEDKELCQGADLPSKDDYSATDDCGNTLSVSVDDDTSNCDETSSDDLQEAALDGDAVRQLCALLIRHAPKTVEDSDMKSQMKANKDWGTHNSSKPSSSSVNTMEGCLRALGYLCMARAEARRQLLDAKVGFLTRNV